MSCVHDQNPQCFTSVLLEPLIRVPTVPCHQFQLGRPKSSAELVLAMHINLEASGTIIQLTKVTTELGLIINYTRKELRVDTEDNDKLVK